MTPAAPDTVLGAVDSVVGTVLDLKKLAELMAHNSKRITWNCRELAELLCLLLA